MPNCGCAGQTCGCRVTGGSGVVVSGTGTAADPFVLSADATGFNIGAAMAVANQVGSGVELSKVGTGAVGDPVTLSGKLVLVSPNNTRYTITVSNSGALSTAPTT